MTEGASAPTSPHAEKCHEHARGAKTAEAVMCFANAVPNVLHSTLKLKL